MVPLLIGPKTGWSLDITYISPLEHSLFVFLTLINLRMFNASNTRIISRKKDLDTWLPTKDETSETTAWFKIAFYKLAWNVYKKKLTQKILVFKVQPYQGTNARKVNCSCVYSAYITKPVLYGRNLLTRIDASVFV